MPTFFCRGRHFAIGLLACLLSLPTIVLAGSFQVSPVRVQLTPTAATAAITVRNQSETDDVVVQLRAMNWTQANGEDVYSPSTSLIATPPIFTMKPGASQTVRLGLRKTVLADTQQTFRLYITEVPPPPKEGFQGLQVALNIGIPIFVAPKVFSNTPPSWKARMAGDNKLTLSTTNNANAHIQILEISIFDEQDDVAIAVSQQPRYVLANQTTTWQIPLTRAPKGKLRLTARTDANPLAASLTLEAASTTSP